MAVGASHFSIQLQRAGHMAGRQETVVRIRWGRLLLVLGLMALATVGCLAALAALGYRSGLETVTEDRPTPSGDDVVGYVEPTEPPSATRGRPATSEVRDVSGLPPFDVLTLQYTPYMATLGLMAARGYMEDEGYALRLHDVYDENVDLDEEGQCAALASGEYDALATTLDATRKCGDGVAVGIPIGQSAGNDAIVVKPGVTTWNQVFEHAVGFTGFSVSEYMACFASHTANQPMRLPVRFDDASEAVDAWLNSGPEQDIQSIVVWQPEVARALESLPGSQELLSSRSVRILWDVLEFSRANASADPAQYEAFTRAYYRALKDLTEDPDGSLAAIVDWAGEDPARQALLTTTDPAEFRADLDNEAFATLRDAGILMSELDTLRHRLDESAFYWGYCNVDVPEVASEDDLIAADFVLKAREDSSLLAAAGAYPSAQVFQVTDFTDASAVTDQQIQDAKVLFETGIEIEFQPNRTEFRDAAAANAILANAVRFLRTCQDCLLQVQGGAAYPGEAVCPACRPEDSDSLAVERGRKVYTELMQRFDVPEAQLRFLDTPHAPQFPGSNREDELRLDRRTFLAGLQLAGR